MVFASAPQNGDLSKRRRALQAYPDASMIPLEGESSQVMSALAHNKPALLTPSQKKANHIQSEQKRRANIRRGYEALCATVPALREAIRIEEEAQRAAAAAAANDASNGKRKKRKQKDESEKNIDGRAGPKSENVVLQKSKYIHSALSKLRVCYKYRVGEYICSFISLIHHTLMYSGLQSLSF